MTRLNITKIEWQVWMHETYNNRRGDCAPVLRFYFIIYEYIKKYLKFEDETESGATPSHPL